MDRGNCRAIHQDIIFAVSHRFRARVTPVASDTSVHMVC
jgi:hypothetical protein